MSSSACTNPLPRQDFFSHISTFFTEEPGEVADTASLVCELVEHFSSSEATKENFASHSSRFDAIKKFHAIPGIFKKISSLRDLVNQRFKANDSTAIDKKIFTEASLAMKNTAEASLFFHNINVIDLKEGFKSAKRVFWSGLGAFDVFNLIVTHPDTLQEIENKIQETSDPQLKSLYSHQRNHTYIEVTKSVILVAMAVISLISLTFAAAVEGLLIFSTGFFLTLASAWTALNLFNFFYEKVTQLEIDQRKEEILI